MHQGFRTPPDQIDMNAAERAIRIAGTVSIVCALAAGAIAYWTLPALFAFPQGLAERMAFGVQVSLFALIWVVVGFAMVSTARRFSPDDIGGSAAGPPSDRVAIKAAFLQNTLEQSVIACGAYLAVATLVSGDWLSILIPAVILFGLGRFLFLCGYRRGVTGRALGMSLTAMPTVLLYLLAVVLIVLKAVS